MLKIFGLILLCACLANAQKFPLKAIAMLSGGLMEPETNKPIFIFGDVKFVQETADGPTVAKLNITFSPSDSIVVNQERGIHIHQFGISTSSHEPTIACESAGPHWNPAGVNHGSLNDMKSHIGDLGNAVVTPVNGVIQTEIVSPKITLTGPNSIVGRGLVLHAKPDDMGKGAMPGTIKTGNAGSRIACGTIGIMP
jgi:Cu-Zn family superoxide dismutase